MLYETEGRLRAQSVTDNKCVSFSSLYSWRIVYTVVTFLDDNQFNEFFLICASICQSVSSGVASIYSFCWCRRKKTRLVNRDVVKAWGEYFHWNLPAYSHLSANIFHISVNKAATVQTSLSIINFPGERSVMKTAAFWILPWIFINTRVSLWLSEWGF